MATTIPITHHIVEMKNRSHKQKAVIFKRKGYWREVTWHEYYHYIRNLAAGLQSLGIGRGDKIAIMSNSRFEWAVTDLAVFGLGAVSVPIYHNNLCEDVEYILQNSEAQILFCENKDVYERWLEVAPKCPQVKEVFVYDSFLQPGINTFRDLLLRGEEYGTKHPNFFDESCEQAQMSDMATIVYTSGTTGLPKGVVLTHEQIMSEISEVFPLLGISSLDRGLTFLPFAHILGRIEMWGHVYCGFTQAYAENLDTIRNDMLKLKPTVMVAVPRIFEKIYNAVRTQAESTRAKKALFNWAIKVGKEVSLCQRQRQSVPWSLASQYALANKLIFSKLKTKMGGNLKVAFSGGAPLDKEIAEFFHACGILILEGYGLTETTAAITVNTPFSYEFGSVGMSVGDVQLKIAEDGEVLVKSKKVMKEYYKDPEATQKVLKDGWFATGDIGEINDGFLKITDRKKDLIKTAGGKYVAPQKISGLLKLNRYVSNVHIHGDRRKYVAAIIAPNIENVKAFAREHKIKFANERELMDTPEVTSLFNDAVADVNTHLASYETVKKFYLLDRDFTVENGELTPSMKVKRKAVDEKFAQAIAQMYGESA